MHWITDHWPLVAILVVGALAVWRLLPRGAGSSRTIGLFLGVIATGLVVWQLARPHQDLIAATLFYTFAGVAVISAIFMVTDSNPVYASLWFAMATLGVCGLFILNSATFLAAVTIIVYAGAVVVTFVFVIMLAQQENASGYDRKAQQPLIATLLGTLLLACVIAGVERLPASISEKSMPLVADKTSYVSSIPNEDLGTPLGVGRSLFVDYVYASELAGTVLLVATIGAIAIAPRRAQGGL